MRQDSNSQPSLKLKKVYSLSEFPILAIGSACKYEFTVLYYKELFEPKFLLVIFRTFFLMYLWRHKNTADNVLNLLAQSVNFLYNRIPTEGWKSDRRGAKNLANFWLVESFSQSDQVSERERLKMVVHWKSIFWIFVCLET